ncbi:MAG: hypothetical protein N2Z22_06190 [Turneriella sp.]|nr:hypothetical protein [Leptospiraceae bacterium]MCX7632903.1 hypothetical protein [Turneriella sp.]
MRRCLYPLFGALASLLGCTAGVAHTITVILPTPHLVAEGKNRQFGTLYFYTDRNMPETSNAYAALLKGQIAEALDELSKIRGSDLPTVQRAYWQNDVAVCFILEGRYKEADELLLQAGLWAEEEPIRHNHRMSVYLAESHAFARKQQAEKTSLDQDKDKNGKSIKPPAAPAKNAEKVAK